MAAKPVALKDRLARLTVLCTEIQNAASVEKLPTTRLEDVLSEAEHLCREVRGELRRRRGE
jgi:hypothetical protein